MGVGTRLVQRCLSILESSLPEVTEAYLHVQTSNDEAIQFYKRFGFEIGEVIQNYYTRIDPPHAVILKKNLCYGE
jgi:ribosomal protein S18 acetylase RimI-like enzyme